MAVYKPRRLRNETEPEQVREPSLYRSLCTSLLSTLLSLVMLVGTTFAWFTESITTGVYTITAGNLSTVTSYCTDLTNLNWQLLNPGNNDLFGGTTFSKSNATRTAYLKLENESPNPVKYLISFVYNSETAGTLKKSDGTTAANQNLSELMSFAYTVTSDATPTFTGTANKSLTLSESATSPFSIIVEGNKTVYVKLELTLGSYEGEWTGTPPSIDLKLELVITQPDGDGKLEENNTASQTLQTETPVTVGEAATSEGANLTVGVTIENAPETPAPAGEPADKPVGEGFYPARRFTESPDRPSVGADDPVRPKTPRQRCLFPKRGRAAALPPLRRFCRYSSVLTLSFPALPAYG